jgi:hypothetical protein
LDREPSVTDLEDDPLADYIVECGPLRKLDDALRCTRFSVRGIGIRAWPLLLAAGLDTATGPGFWPFRILAIAR